ncbi:MAG TPA: flagellar hook-associated protein FlgK [Candidatus Binatia bacterium]|nr:flagellar hook-associated protein FlgK [Candidatus Binatia bacterium]
MALSPVLSIAERALLANDTALEVVGNNISNVNTPGYSRQVPDFRAGEPVVDVSGKLVGTGGEIRAIDRIVEPLLEKRLAGAETSKQQQGALSDQLSALAGVLNDLQDPSLSSTLSSFFDALDALANNPAGLAERQAVLGRAQAVAAELNRRSASVATLQRNADDGIVADVGTANDLLQQIAALNVSIASAETGGQKANDLRDARQQAIVKLAGLVAIQTQEDARGGVSISTSNGIGLVTAGTLVHRFAVDDGAQGLDGLLLHTPGLVDDAGNFLDVAGTFAGGAIAGLLAARDQSFPAASTALDTFATTFRDAVNGIQQAGFDLDGSSTAAVPLFGGTGARDLVVLLDPAADPSAPRRLAAGTTTNPGDNTNALALADLRTTALAALGGVTLSDYLGIEQGRVGEDASRASDAAEVANLLQRQLENQRQAVSGVNLNEELTNLIRYQNAFQAASQVVRVANAVLQDLVSILR